MISEINLKLKSFTAWRRIGNISFGLYRFECAFFAGVWLWNLFLNCFLKSCSKFLRVKSFLWLSGSQEALLLITVIAAFCYVFRRNHICQSFCRTVSYCIFDLFDCDDYIFDQKEIQKQIVFMYNEGIIKYLACIFHARYSRITVFLMRYAAAVLCVIYTPRSSAFGMYFLTVWRNSLSSSVL